MLKLKEKLKKEESAINKDTGILNRPILRAVIIAAGFICVGLGVIGIFLPLIPATDFFLLAAACFAISSPKFYHWLLNNRLFGKYIRNYREGKGMTLFSKIWTLLFLWFTISYSVYVIDNIYVRIVLILIAVGVTIHVLVLKTAK